MKKKKILKYILSLSTLVTVSLSFANCPDPSTLSYFCEELPSGQACYWITQNACFEASAKGFGAKNGDKAGPFIGAAWWQSSSSAKLGTSSCFYQGPKGYGLINAFQGANYGEVPKPQSSNWRPSVKAGTFSCQGNNVGDCQFKFCNR